MISTGKSLENNLSEYLLAEMFGEISLLKYYFPEFEGLGKYNSNLRDDDLKTKSLSVTCKKGKLIISDFGTVHIGLNVFEYLSLLLGLDNKQILSRIARDFGVTAKTDSLPTLYKNEYEDNAEKSIKTKRREWNRIDKMFWGDKYNINFETILPILKFYDTRPLSHYWINKWEFKVPEYKPSYCYWLNNQYKKIYSPYSDNFKWSGNVPKNLVFGLKQLPRNGELLLLESSMKDTMFDKIIGITSLPLNSETTFIPKHVLQHLRLRFKKIVLHLNNDRAGIEMSKKFSKEYNLPYFVNPKDSPKDSSDYVKKHGLRELKYMIKKLI